jgi:hypothetical protein
VDPKREEKIQTAEMKFLRVVERYTRIEINLTKLENN